MILMHKMGPGTDPSFYENYCNCSAGLRIYKLFYGSEADNRKV